MSVVEASAPGKLVLLGEYAVLFGHPAMVAAVDRRARVELRAADGDHWSVEAPGFADEGASFDLDRDRRVRWRGPGTAAADRFALVANVIDSLAAARFVEPEDLRPARLVLDTRAFFLPTAGGSAKLGLGSSAALTVALTEALRRWRPDAGRPDPVDLASLLEMHRSLQGGKGSGVDLAASRLGGVVEYRLAGERPTPSARPIVLPEGVLMVVLWTGRSASTARFLATLAERMQSDGEAATAALAELGEVSAAGIAHVRAGDVPGFLDDVADFAESMGRLGHAAGIRIFSEEHVALHGLARDCGLSYKPSGAGGGDVGIGFTDDPEAAAVFTERAAAAGFPRLDLEIDPVGVESESSVLESRF